MMRLNLQSSHCGKAEPTIAENDRKCLNRILIGLIHLGVTLRNTPRVC